MQAASTHRTIVDHMWGPLGSLAFHALLILALVFLVKPREGTFEVVGNGAFPLDDSKPVRPVDAPLVPERFRPDPADIAPVEEPAFVDRMSDGDALTVTDPAGSFSGTGPVADRFAGLDIESFENIAWMPGLQRGRLERIAAATGQPPGNSGPVSGRQRPGGNGLGEVGASVERALVWLRDHQQADGSWGPDKPAMTGLALLTFLGYGESVGSRRFGPTVRKAIDWLCANQQEDGWWCQDRKQHAAVYAHAIATYAISEAYGVTRIPELRERMERAAAVIVSGQQPGGLWDYGYAKGPRRDTSVSGWQLQALKAAHLNGAEVDGLAAALARAGEGLAAMQQPGGGLFLYSEAGSARPSMSAVAALGLAIVRQSGTRPARASLDVLRELPCDWRNPPRWPLYTWYYQAQALFHDGGPAWSTWSRQFTTRYCGNQNADGSWNSPAADSAGNEETRHGPVYSTAIAALTLEVFFRYAPMSQSLHEQRRPAVPREADDVRVEII